MATPEELQEAFDEIKEELQVLRKNLTLISDDSDFLDERNSLQEEINSKHEEYLETIQTAIDSNIDLDTSGQEESLTEIKKSIEGNGTAQKDSSTEQVGLLKRMVQELINPSEDPFAKEKEKEKKSEDEKQRGFLKRIAEGVDEINEGLGVEEISGIGIGGLLALVAGIAAGLVLEIVDSIKDLAKGIKFLFGQIGIRLTNILGKIGIKTFDKIKDGIIFIRNFFQRITKFLRNKLPPKLVKQFDDFIDSVKATFGKVGKFFKKLSPFGSKVDEVSDASKKGFKLFDKIRDFFKGFKNIFTKIDDALAPITKFFKQGVKAGRGFGKLLGPVGLLISIVDGVFQSVKGFVDGFKDGGGLVGGLKGAIEGLFNSLVGDVVNMGADLAGFILKKLGAENIGQAFMDFDFITKLKEWYASLDAKIQEIIPKLKEGFDKVKLFIEDVKNFFTETIPSFFQKLKDKLFEIGNTILEKIGVFNPLSMIRDGIINLMPNIFGLKGKVAELLGTTVGDTSARIQERQGAIIDFGSEIKRHVLTNVVSVLPDGLGIRKKASELLGVPYVATGIVTEKPEKKGSIINNIGSIFGLGKEDTQTPIPLENPLIQTKQKLIDPSTEKRDLERQPMGSSAAIVNAPTSLVTSNTVSNTTNVSGKTVSIDKRFTENYAY